MDIEKALKLKKIRGLNWDEFAEGLPIKGNSLRVAFNRKSVPIEYLEIIFERYSQENVQLAQLNQKDFIDKLKKSHGYNNAQMGDIVDMSGDALRMAANENKLSKFKIEIQTALNQKE